MKPTEDSNISNYNIEGFDYEISPLELVQDIGVLIFEGRLPEFSKNGRREGDHCWPLCSNSKKECCNENITDKSSMCCFVESARRKIESEWKKSTSIVVEVLVCLDNLFPNNETDRDPCEIYLDVLPPNASQRTLLLERWKLEVCEKSSNLMQHPVTSSSSSVVSINLLLQAIRSFLHFSQLSAWFMRTGGRVPKQIMYRISHGESCPNVDFQSHPEIHEFPQAMTSKTQNFRSTVFALPRFDLETLISMSPYRKYNLPIERQILMSSLERIPSKTRDAPSHKTNLNSLKCRDDCARDSDKKIPSCNRKKVMVDCYDEITPSRRFEVLKKRKTNDNSVDAIFVPDPVKYFRKKEIDGKELRASGKLRKRLSFDEKFETKDCFTIRDSVMEKVDQRLERLRDLPHDKGKEMAKKSNNLFTRPNRHSKSQTCLEGDHKSMETVCNALDECRIKRELYHGSIRNGNSCDVTEDSVKCKFLIGENVVDNESVSEDFQTPHKSENGTNVHENFDQRLNDKCSNVDVKIKESSTIGEDSTREDEVVSLGKKIEDLEMLDLSKSFVVNGGNDTSELNMDSKKEQMFETGSSVSDFSTDLDNNTSQSFSMKSKNGRSYPEKCHSSEWLTSLENKRNCVDKLRRCESYSGARPKQMTSSYASACSVAVFNSSTGLPIASSPAPLRRPESTFPTGRNLGNGECLSPSVEIRKKRKTSYDSHIPSQSKLLLSRSAPASTRLLGNFEESVLKGRLPVFGTVEGFTAEVGASGSFCPKHITLPVKCQFFRTSDDNAPSPYMGHITFNKSKGKRGYHVPRKGTIQLTLFNPHKTVVKVFVVIYNFHDMPSNSHTFLRQKIVSVRNNSADEEEPQNLHYLVHLRFASTRHDHVYLHTDIRLIFPQQTPEISSSKLKVLTYGPVEPKYTLRYR